MEGKNIRVLYRFADGNVERFTEMTAEVVSLGASIIVTSSTTAIRAAHRAAPNIAIVSWASGDPILMGWAQTLARPGGMITGLFLVASSVEKPLELLKEMRPLATTFGYLFNATNPGNAEFRRIVEEAAARLGIKVDVIEVKESPELAEAFRRMQSYGAQGVAVMADPLFGSNLPMISRLAREHRIPTVADGRDFAEQGGLLAQTVNYLGLARRSAWYVDQILKGTPAGDLPADQTTEYKLIVNLKTAKELGLTIPPSILTRADEVID
jgi:putative ABC transport system substrate-binding protein